MDDVAVVILHHRFWPGIRASLDALIGEGLSDARVCIVDNASHDGSVEHLRESYPHIDVLLLPDNLGYGGGMNAAVRRSSAHAVLLLTHETVVLPGCVDALCARLDDDTRIGIVGPLLLLRDDPLTVFSEGGRLDRNMTPSHRADGSDVADHTRDPPCQVDWLDGSCLLVRRDVFETVGLFDENYFLYFEEVDFMVRARRAGWRVECVPAAHALQQPGRLPVALWVRNQLRFLQRNASRRALFRQLLVDGRALARGPDRRLVLLGMVGWALRMDPSRLHRASIRGGAVR